MQVLATLILLTFNSFVYGQEEPLNNPIIEDLVKSTFNYDSWSYKITKVVQYEFGTGIDNHQEKDLILLYIKYEDKSSNRINGEKYIYLDMSKKQYQEFSFYLRYKEKRHTGLWENIGSQNWVDLDCSGAKKSMVMCELYNARLKDE